MGSGENFRKMSDREKEDERDSVARENVLPEKMQKDCLVR